MSSEPTPAAARPSARASRRAAVLRRADPPAPTYPEELPITARRPEILAALAENQVVVVAGETGSGKTTQLPKMCLELGRGVAGMIGHTQPRRVAARTVAERIAEELSTPLGDLVGYTVRFTDEVSDRTMVKVMTDGILLAEIQRDRRLAAYDTIIVDEAHERSLNIDFLIGYLTRLLPRRPDLKVIITSATIDTARFAEHFGGAPVIEVSGRTYPVELRYRPLATDDGEERDQFQAVCDAVDELRGEGPGDILVFLSGEREIRDAADAVRRMELPDTHVLPLYARLSAAEQHRVFQPHAGRRVVLATNVAETSLTVPGVRYVVDAGTARISRYNHRTKVQRLPIEPVSKASADQRAGRCGRVAEGVCIRLYAEEDYADRPDYTDPEIVRTNLASVILQMAAIGLGDVASFPFIDPPDARQVRDGVALLEELGAFEAHRHGRRLTPLGRRLAQLPVDPRLGRMVLEAERNGCLREVTVIAAALSIQDPRERPSDRRGEADAAHARFADGASDFTALLRLWEYLQERQQALSSSQFRRLCRDEFLNFLRVREWQDLYSQLRQVTRGMGLHPNRTPAPEDSVHRALLSGLLSHIGLRDDSAVDRRRRPGRPERRREFVGARSARFAIAAGSSLSGRPPRWVMAAELVETNRLWARTVGRSQPEWAEALGAHLVKRTWSDPHWDRRRASVTALERVTLYGLPLVENRRVDYGRVDPVLARDMFIRCALVEGDWDTDHAFFHHNRKLIDEVSALEDRARRRDLLIGDDELHELFDARVGADVVSGRSFDRWWSKASRADPDLLSFTPELLIRSGAGAVSLASYPDQWFQGDLALRLSYEFEPGSEYDGVTVHVPLPFLNQVTAEGFDWQVPGLREELVTALLRMLPKGIRRALVPAAEHAGQFLATTGPDDGPLAPSLARYVARVTGEAVPPGTWDGARLPDHLRMTFLVEDPQGRPLATGKDLGGLRRLLDGQFRACLSRLVASTEAEGLTSWTVGALPDVLDRRWKGQTVRAYPALVDEGDTVALRVLPTAAEQRRAMWAGTRRLLMLNLGSPVRRVERSLGAEARLAMAHAPHLSVAELHEDCLAAAVDQLIARHGGPARDEDAFNALLRSVKHDLGPVLGAVVAAVGDILAARRRIEARLDATTATSLAPAVADIRDQIDGLVYPGFVAATGAGRLADLVRYLRAVERRLDKLPGAPQADADRMRRVQALDAEYRAVLGNLPPGGAVVARRIRWMLEELRVSYFAQVLGTPEPVSEERIRRALGELARG
ncbi:MAG TPA: ATP-dependent RNA helicase HrpA [Acidimicrobiales bacterium]|nr:ATP-dependent RNA helicase HrpA [Acidimicrobiales bacterium]